MSYNKLQPIVKWAGGKRQLLSSIMRFFPSTYVTYYEPFVGGGAVLLYLHPKHAVINDLNSELINVYEVLHDLPNDLIQLLLEHQRMHCSDYYYKIRALDRNMQQFTSMSNVERAARMIYLNRTCYNGLYRVNKQGRFNTPIGRYNNPKIVDKNGIFQLSEYLNTASIKICCGDYAASLNDITESDFVYLDPPYQPLAPTSNFTRYTKEGFGWGEQIRLKEICDKLTQKHVRFLQSNADTPEIRDLYKDYNMVSFPAYRWINSRGAERWSGIGELLIANFKEDV